MLRTFASHWNKERLDAGCFCHISVAEHKPGVLGLIPGDYRPFHFSPFAPKKHLISLYYDFFFSFLPLVCIIQKHIEVLLPALDSKLILVMSWEKTLLMNLSSNAGLGLGCRKSMN